MLWGLNIIHGTLSEYIGQLVTNATVFGGRSVKRHIEFLIGTAKVVNGLYILAC